MGSEPEGWSANLSCKLEHSSTEPGKNLCAQFPCPYMLEGEGERTMVPTSKGCLHIK